MIDWTRLLEHRNTGQNTYKSGISDIIHQAAIKGETGNLNPNDSSQTNNYQDQQTTLKPKSQILPYKSRSCKSQIMLRFPSDSRLGFLPDFGLLGLAASYILAGNSVNNEQVSGALPTFPLKSENLKVLVRRKKKFILSQACQAF